MGIIRLIYYIMTCYFLGKINYIAKFLTIISRIGDSAIYLSIFLILKFRLVLYKYVQYSGLV